MLYFHFFQSTLIAAAALKISDPTPLTTFSPHSSFLRRNNRHNFPKPPHPSLMSNHNSLKTFDWTFDTEPETEPLQIKGGKLLFFIAIFTIIILFTLIFLCARWIFRNRGLLNPPHAPSHTSAFPSPSQGLDADAIKKLPIILHQIDYSNRALEETECCICLSAFKDGDKLKVLPSCDHCFHCECVDVWLINHSSCPLCRASLKIDYAFPQILIQEPPIRYNNNVVPL